MLSYVNRCSSDFWAFVWSPWVWPLQWKLLTNSVLISHLLCCKRYLKWVLLLSKTLACYHWNESYWSEASCGIIYYAAQGGSVDKTLVCENTNESINFMLCFQVIMFVFQVFLQNFNSHNQKITLNYPLEHQPYAFSRLSSFHHGLWAPWDAELLTPPIRDQTKTRRQKKISKIFYIASTVKLTNHF